MIGNACLIYPHQLFAESLLLTLAMQNAWPIYLVEEALLLTYNPSHRQKLMLHKLSMDAFQHRLRRAGFNVIRLSLADCPDAGTVFTRLHRDGIKVIHCLDTTDNYLEKALATSGFQRIWYETRQFLLSKNEAIDRYQASGRRMARFYQKLRQDFEILLTDQGQPVGGQWSFDQDNRRKIPKNKSLPPEIEFYQNQQVTQASQWLSTVNAQQHGQAGCWLPYSHEDAGQWLNDFLHQRLADFGAYEDAITSDGVRLWHSALSPLLNIGLLTPQQVLAETLSFARQNPVPINSLEGFVRQILGWREFIRASYECDGGKMRNGNFFLLTQTHPDEVYRWFMSFYLDAYDWVMVPNVYSMSQYADGGLFATKPYISGANYLTKMSDYPKGDWQAVWTALYWHFIDAHQAVFANNPRLAMMPRLLARMSPETRARHLRLASVYLANL